jgi:hypothetical protein
MNYEYGYASNHINHPKITVQTMDAIMATVKQIPYVTLFGLSNVCSNVADAKSRRVCAIRRQRYRSPAVMKI